MISDTAIHEAAHAVIGHALGLHVHSLSVVKKGDAFGHVVFSWRKKPCPVVISAMFMAGHEACVLWCGHAAHRVPRQDWKDMGKAGVSARGAGIVRPELLRALRQYKRVIFAVARELERSGRMSRRKFLAVVKGVLG